MVAGTIKHAASGRCFANKHWRSGQSPDRKDAVAGIVMATASYLGSLMRANKLMGRWRRRETNLLQAGNKTYYKQLKTHIQYSKKQRVGKR